MSYKIKIKEIRTKKNMSQEDLADKIGIDQVMISKYETKKTEPSLKRLVQIAQELNVTLDQLVEYDKIHSMYSQKMLNIMRDGWKYEESLLIIEYKKSEYPIFVDYNELDKAINLIKETTQEEVEKVLLESNIWYEVQEFFIRKLKLYGIESYAIDIFATHHVIIKKESEEN